MFLTRSVGNCTNNRIFDKFNEEFGVSAVLTYDMQYPAFYNMSNEISIVNPDILNNINKAIKTSALDFKDSISEESLNFNSPADKTSKNSSLFSARSTYAVTYNMDSILSCILDLRGLNLNENILYNTLNNYNIDLLTGKELTLDDIFLTEIDYTTLIANYVKSLMGNSPLYNPIDNIEITKNQSFYLTLDGITIYFGIDEIAPEEFGIVKFQLDYSEFGSYVNPQYYCNV